MATALLAVAVWGVLFSLYLAYVSLFVLQHDLRAVLGLYVVHLGLLVSTAILFVGGARAGAGAGHLAGAHAPRSPRVSAVAALLLLGVVGWKAVRGEQVLTPEEIKRKDPEFYTWYTKLPTVTAPLAGGHSKGQADAVVTVIEFSDFECGHCANAYRSLKQVLPRFQKDVQVRFHHFPLDAACNPAVKHSVHQVRVPGRAGGRVRRRAGTVLGVPRSAVRAISRGSIATA